MSHDYSLQQWIHWPPPQTKILFIITNGIIALIEGTNLMSIFFLRSHHIWWSAALAASCTNPRQRPRSCVSRVISLIVRPIHLVMLLLYGALGLPRRRFPSICTVIFDKAPASFSYELLLARHNILFDDTGTRTCWRVTISCSTILPPRTCCCLAGGHNHIPFVRRTCCI